MLLTIEHPELLPHLDKLGYGLQPVYHAGRGRYFLVVKATKEVILTARLNREFKIYLLGDKQGPGEQLGFITAFFDDPDEPLTIKSPQFTDDDLLKGLTGLFGQSDFDIYFFDEHNREMMGVHAHHADAERFRETMANATFPVYSYETFPSIIRRLDDRFGVRDEKDDAEAFTIQLGENLYPDNFVHLDARDDAYQFQGSDRCIAMTCLEREEPGSFQERDIAMLLGRVFQAEHIYLNPVRDDTGKELTDVLVYTDEIMMFVQAKDSPNTEAALRRTVERKRLAIRAHIAKASKQVKGAIAHAAKAREVLIRTSTSPITLRVDQRQLLGMVVVQEMFDDDYAACSAPVIKTIRTLNKPAILLDYSGLHIMAQNLRTPASFIRGLGRMFKMAIDNDEFPKPVHFGPPQDGN